MISDAPDPPRLTDLEAAVHRRPADAESWRALADGYDVSKVAKHFNGGGHAAAAGADIPGALIEIQPLVLKTTREMLALK